jgi:hypothetical protein
MKKQLDLGRSPERRSVTSQPQPTSPKKELEIPEPVVAPTQPPIGEPTSPSNDTHSISLITILLLAIIVIMIGFIYYIFFLSA